MKCPFEMAQHKYGGTNVFVRGREGWSLWIVWVYVVSFKNCHSIYVWRLYLPVPAQPVVIRFYEIILTVTCRINIYMLQFLFGSHKRQNLHQHASSPMCHNQFSSRCNCRTLNLCTRWCLPSGSCNQRKCSLSMSFRKGVENSPSQNTLSAKKWKRSVDISVSLVQLFSMVFLHWLWKAQCYFLSLTTMQSQYVPLSLSPPSFFGHISEQSADPCWEFAVQP